MKDINKQFKHLNLGMSKEWYRVRLPKSLGRHNISLGTQKSQDAILKCFEIEAQIDSWLEKGEAIDIPYLKSLAKKKIKVVKELPSVKEVWIYYIDANSHSWSESYKRTFLKVISNFLEKYNFSLNDIKKIFTEAKKHFKTPRTAKKRLVIINACLRWAVQENIIPENYFRQFSELLKNFKLPKEIKESAIDKVISKEDNERIIEWLKSHNYPQNYIDFIWLLRLTGMRPSEAYAVNKSSWLFEKKLIKINRAIVLHGTKLIHQDTTKTRKERFCPLPDYFSKEFIPYALFNYGNWLKAFRKANKALGLNYTPYCYRHTYITEQIENNVPLPRIAKIVGNSVAMLEKHYYHLIH